MQRYFSRNGYSCDLDSLSVGSRLGMMRSKEGGLHYTVNGQDQGVAIDSVPPNVYAVIDLYGVCAQASVLHTGAGGHVARHVVCTVYRCTEDITGYVAGDGARGEQPGQLPGHGEQRGQHPAGPRTLGGCAA